MENYQNKLTEIKSSLNKLSDDLVNLKEELIKSAKDEGVKVFISKLEIGTDYNRFAKDLEFILSLDLLNLKIEGELPNALNHTKPKYISRNIIRRSNRTIIEISNRKRFVQLEIETQPPLPEVTKISVFSGDLVY
jgi:hypothetical protein